MRLFEGIKGVVFRMVKDNPGIATQRINRELENTPLKQISNTLGALKRDEKIAGNQTGWWPIIKRKEYWVVGSNTMRCSYYGGCNEQG